MEKPTYEAEGWSADVSVDWNQVLEYYMAPRWMRQSVPFLEKGRVGPEDGGQG